MLDDLNPIVCLSVHFRQDGGTFQMIVFDTDVTFAVQLGRGVGGHPFVTSVNCEAHVGGVDIHLSGGARYDRNSGMRGTLRVAYKLCFFYPIVGFCSLL